MTVLKVMLTFVASFVALMSANNGAAQVSGKVGDVIRKIAPKVAEIPCSDPALTRQGIELTSGRLNSDKTGVELRGCFGINQSGQLRAWLRTTAALNGSNTNWRMITDKNTDWNSTAALVTLAPSDSQDVSVMQASIVLLNAQGSPRQLSDWVNVVLPRTGPVEREDADGDGSASYASGGDDCDDSDPRRFPGNVEVADSDDHDEDCNPRTFGNRDVDGDGYYDARACNRDGAGGLFCGTDCNDNDPSVHPNQVDILNGRDDNCTGDVDEHQTVDMVLELLGLPKRD